MDLGSQVFQLLTGLVDDAGLFPPSSLPMAQALERHRRSKHPMLSGRFLCPLDRAGELEALLENGSGRPPLQVHLIGEPPYQQVRGFLGFGVRALESRSPTETYLPVYVEGVEPKVLKDLGLLGKLRCGGARIPPVDEVADYVIECARVGLPFKGTAGMHAAVRGWEDTDGAPHHGYLNLVLAVARALRGGDVEGVLLSTDHESLAHEALSLDADLVRATRATFHSYGSCDTERPVADAQKLGLA